MTATGLFLLPAPFGEHPPIPAQLTYDPADPYAVLLTFADRHGRPTASYTFAREILTDGLQNPAGDGDIQVGPHEDDYGDRLVIVLAHPGDDPIVYYAGRTVIEKFLDDTYALVPMSTEHRRINWDAELAAVLGGQS